MGGKGGGGGGGGWWCAGGVLVVCWWCAGVKEFGFDIYTYKYMSVQVDRLTAVETK